jgi:ABC-type transport system substrate-binding protein
MHKKISVAIALALILTMLVTMVPVSAWVYPDCTQDDKVEFFGPRLDKLVIKYYADETVEFDALEAGEIDFTDWAVTAEKVTAWQNHPDIKLVWRGTEFGMFVLDLNNNPNPYLGYPQNPTYPNPVYPNPMSESNLRHAIAHCVDKNRIVSDICGGYAERLDNYVPSSYGIWSNLAVEIHPYDTAEAAAILSGVPMQICVNHTLYTGAWLTVEAGAVIHLYGGKALRYAKVPPVGAPLETISACVDWTAPANCFLYLVGNSFNPDTNEDKDGLKVHVKSGNVYKGSGLFPIGPDGKRYWDRNFNGAKDADEGFELKFYIRQDHGLRREAGTIIYNAMKDPPVSLPVSAIYADFMTCRQKVMTEKNFHLYTGGWGLTADPDQGYFLYHIDMYWHPGRPLNYDAVNCTGHNYYTRAFVTSTNFADALANCQKAQEIFCSPCCIGAIPLWASAGYTAYRRRYTGGTNEAPVTPDDGENQYRGHNWLGVVNEKGLGTWSWYTFYNAHPEGFELGDGAHMTARWGFRVPNTASLNPLYAEWVWDWYILGKSYDSMIAMNPNTLEDVPWIAYNWTIGTWVPSAGPLKGQTLSKVTFYMRDDVYWSDGTPLTAEDVKFTWGGPLDTGSISWWLKKRGLPPTYWSGQVADILSISMPDPWTVEVLLDTTTYFAHHAMSGWNIILPKHIWEPIVNDVMGDSPYGDDPTKMVYTAGPPGTVVPTVCSGPYIIGPYSGVEPSITLTANPWHFHNPHTRPPVNKVVKPKGHIVKIEAPAELIIRKRLHNKWLDHTLDVEKILELSAGKSRVVDFAAGQELHFTYDTTVHYPAGGDVEEWDGTQWVLHSYLPSTQITYPASSRIRIVTPKLEMHFPGGVRELILEHETNVVLPPCEWVNQETYMSIRSPGRYVFKFSFHISSPSTGNPWYCWWMYEIKYVWDTGKARIAFPVDLTVLAPNDILGHFVWATLKEDIYGEYLFKYEGRDYVPIPDLKVNIRDVSGAAGAFGSFPGHPRWNSYADVTGDNQVNIRDVSAIAGKFGWVGEP